MTAPYGQPEPFDPTTLAAPMRRAKPSTARRLLPFAGALVLTMAAFGGGTTGTIGSVSANQMTITTAAGAQRIVLLTPSTAVTQVTSTTKSVVDLTNGETVAILGTANPDGSVTATNVVIGDVGLFGRGSFGGDRSPSPSTAP